MIEESLPITLLLNGITLPLMLGISLWTGLKAAQHRGGVADVVGGSLFLGLWSIPQIWAGVLLLGYLANKSMLHWFPAGGLHDLRDDEMNFLPTLVNGFHRGWLLDTAWHLVSTGDLPAVRRLRIHLQADPRSLARIHELRFRPHRQGQRRRRTPDPLPPRPAKQPASRSSPIPPPSSQSLISGSIIVETIFAIPGMGKLGVDAVFDKDKEMVLSITLVASILGLVSFLLGDIAYAIADPRVKLRGRILMTAGAMPTAPSPPPCPNHPDSADLSGTRC